MKTKTRSIPRSRAGWGRVLSSFGTPARPRLGDDGEQLWPGPRDVGHIDLLLPQTPSLLLISPKRQWIDHWWAESLLRGVAVVSGTYLGDRRALPVLEAACRLAGAAVFVGDIDPYSIVQFVETRRLMAKARLPLTFGGVDDAWLAAMERGLNLGRHLENVFIPLSKLEIMLLKRIDQAIDLEQLVGARACSILHGGHKIEIEGATNSRLHRRSHGRWIFQYLRSRVDQARGQP